MNLACESAALDEQSCVLQNVLFSFYLLYQASYCLSDCRIARVYKDKMLKVIRINTDLKRYEDNMRINFHLVMVFSNMN